MPDAFIVKDRATTTTDRTLDGLLEYLPRGSGMLIILAIHRTLFERDWRTVNRNP